MSIADKISDLMQYKNRLITACNSKQSVVPISSTYTIRVNSQQFASAIYYMTPAKQLASYNIGSTSSFYTITSGINTSSASYLWQSIYYSWNVTQSTNDYYYKAAEWIAGDSPYWYVPLSESGINSSVSVPNNLPIGTYTYNKLSTIIYKNTTGNAVAVGNDGIQFYPITSPASGYSIFNIIYMGVASIVATTKNNFQYMAGPTSAAFSIYIFPNSKYSGYTNIYEPTTFTAFLGLSNASKGLKIYVPSYMYSSYYNTYASKYKNYLYSIAITSEECARL